mmetsp:Transcript_29122/g.31310  ORF Transcript_29122/g.31310 Transcript_29122/m.31310 type:complete len:147 (-) Transcript_29122:43-483(-)
MIVSTQDRSHDHRSHHADTIRYDTIRTAFIHPVSSHAGVVVVIVLKLLPQAPTRIPHHHYHDALMKVWMTIQNEQKDKKETYNNVGFGCLRFCLCMNIYSIGSCTSLSNNTHTHSCTTIVVTSSNCWIHHCAVSVTPRLDWIRLDW